MYKVLSRSHFTHTSAPMSNVVSSNELYVIILPLTIVWRNVHYYERHSWSPRRWSKVNCAGWKHWSRVIRVSLCCHEWQYDPVSDRQHEDYIPEVRLFVYSSLNTASPPSVSRTGIFYVNQGIFYITHRLKWDPAKICWEGSHDNKIQEAYTSFHHLPHTASFAPHQCS